MTTTDPLQEAANQVAQGQTPSPDLELDERSRRNLERLAAIASLFSQGAEPVLSRWGHLEVLDTLGQGGFGVVYRALDSVLQRDVALKLLRDADDELRTRLIHEARRMARVRHPNVLAVHGADTHDGQAGIWSDLIRGETLARRIADDWRPGGTELVTLADQLLQALDAVHGRGLVHGDIKPSNLMFDEDERLVLMDFGAAQKTETSGSPRYGSPRYMAPELFTGAPSSAATDTYAAGVVLCHAATGKFPDCVRQSPEEDVPTIGDAARRRHLGRDWSRVLGNMLHNDPVQRMTVADARRAVLRIAGAPRRRWRRLSIAAICGSLLLGLVLALLGRNHALEAQARAEASARHTDAVNDMLGSLLRSPRPRNLGNQVTVGQALDDFEPQLEDALIDLPMARADLLYTVGITRKSTGELKKAEAPLREAVALAEQHAPQGRRLLTFRIDLAETLVQLDQGEEAGLIAESVLAQVDERFPDDAQLLVQALSAAAFAKTAANDFAAAEGYIREAVNMGRDLTWAEPADWTGLLIRLSDFSTRQAKFGQAEAAAREAYAHNLEAMGEVHIDTFRSRGEIAHVLLETGRAREALPLAEINYRGIREWLGNDGPYVWEQAQMLAIAHYKLGQYERAIPVIMDTIESTDRLLGPQSSESISMRNNLANNLKYMGRVDEAIEVYRSMRDSAVESLGRESRIAMMSSNNLAEALLEGGRMEQAAREAEAARMLDAKKWGQSHPYTWHAAMIEAAARTQLGQATESAKILDDAAQAFAQSVGETSELYYQALSFQTHALALSDRMDEARALVDQHLDAMSDTLGADHPITKRFVAAIRPEQETRL